MFCVEFFGSGCKIKIAALRAAFPDRAANALSCLDYSTDKPRHLTHV